MTQSWPISEHCLRIHLEMPQKITNILSTWRITWRIFERGACSVQIQSSATTQAQNSYGVLDPPPPPKKKNISLIGLESENQKLNVLITELNWDTLCHAVTCNTIYTRWIRNPGHSLVGRPSVAECRASDVTRYWHRNQTTYFTGYGAACLGAVRFLLIICYGQIKTPSCGLLTIKHHFT
jgi:hypothetical protein